MGRAGAKARTVAAAAAVAGAALLAAGSVHAAAPPTPWNGVNPFVCQVQNVGSGTDFPNPGADPFCVEFDKTQQNITDFGRRGRLSGTASLSKITIATLLEKYEPGFAKYGYSFKNWT